MFLPEIRPKGFYMTKKTAKKGWVSASHLPHTGEPQSVTWTVDQFENILRLVKDQMQEGYCEVVKSDSNKHHHRKKLHIQFDSNMKHVLLEAWDSSVYISITDCTGTVTQPSIFHFKNYRKYRKTLKALEAMLDSVYIEDLVSIADNAIFKVFPHAADAILLENKDE